MEPKPFYGGVIDRVTGEYLFDKIRGGDTFFARNIVVVKRAHNALSTWRRRTGNDMHMRSRKEGDMIILTFTITGVDNRGR